MSIIMGSGMLIVGLEVSIFVVSTLRQARTIDQAVVAQYASESGVESALYQIRKEARTTLRDDSLVSSSTYTSDNRDGAWTFKADGANTVSSERFDTSVDRFTKARIGEQESVDIHIYISSADGFLPAASSIKKMVTFWKSEECDTPGDDVPWIETTASTWDISGVNANWNSATVKKDFQTPTSTPHSVTIENFDQFIGGDPGGKGVTLRIKPFYCSLRSVEILFFDGTGNPVRIPNYYLIRPKGTFGVAQKDVRVILPSTPASSGIFDFTIFSEEKVDKKEE